MKKFIFLSLALSYSFGCNSQNTQPRTSQSGPASMVAAQSLPPGGTLLDGVYATSTAAGSAVLHLFDDDPATSWQALPGAGLDEGILLRFAAPTVLTGLEVMAIDGSGGLMDLSFDGTILFQSAIGVKLDLTGATDEPVSELYIRITHTDREDALEPEAGPYFQPSNLPAGFQSLRLFGDQGQELRLVAPAAQRGTVAASGSLSPAHAYGPERLFDAHTELAWATNAGEGATLDFSFEKPVRITAFKIWNGYQRSPESFGDNARLNAFEFGAKGATPQAYALKDEQKVQTVTLAAPLSGTSFQLLVKSLFPGKKYRDLALSDLVFFDGEQPFTLRCPPSTAETELRNRAARTPLAGILNRGIRSRSSSLEQDFNQLFTLRGDGTFTLNTILTTVDESETISVASGHWDIAEAGASLAKVKITGSIRTTFHQMTSPAPEKITIRTFSEILTIADKTVRGQKVVGNFLFK